MRVSEPWSPRFGRRSGLIQIKLRFQIWRGMPIGPSFRLTCALGPDFSGVGPHRYNALRREGWNSYGKQAVVPMSAPTRG